MRNQLFGVGLVLLTLLVLPQIAGAAIGTPTIAISPANTIFNVTQSVTLTATVSGTAPFTYLFTIANSTNNVVLAQSSLVSTSNTFATFTYAIGQAGTYYGNVLVTDSEVSSNTANSTESPTFTFIVPSTAGPTAPTLGLAGNFTILAETAISTTPGGLGSGLVTGNVGISPAASTYITGFSLALNSTDTFSKSTLITGKVYAPDYIGNADATPNMLTTAVSNMYTAWVTAAGLTDPTATELGAGNIAGMTLTPGLYKWSTGVTIPTSVTLDCLGNSNAVFVFQISQGLDLGNGAQINLIGGCLAQNIYWQVGTQVTLESGSVFQGTILAGTAIVIKDGATLDGRALAQSAVTLIGDSVNGPVSNTAALGTPTISVSRTQLDVGQGITLTANVAGGATPYTYLFSVSNSVTNSILTTNTVVSSSGSATFTLTPSQTGAYWGNVLVTDSENSPVSSISPQSTAFTVNSALAAPLVAPTLSNTVLNAGNTLTLSTSAATTGTGPWLYNFIISFVNGTTLTSHNSMSTSYVYTANTANTFIAKVVVTDGLGFTANSPSATFTVLAVNVTPSNFTGTSPVNLGLAANFTILAKAGISTTGVTSVVGNIGVSPIAASAITGFALVLNSSGQFSKSTLVTGDVYAADYASPTPNTLTTAVLNMQAAYTNASGRAPTVTGLGGGNIGGLVLAPGVYEWSTGVAIPTSVTLTGGANAVWIFQIAENLNVSNGAAVILSGGAQPKNIYWVVAGGAVLGTTSEVQGSILSQTSIILNTGATLNGRALAQTAVTLDADVVTPPTTPNTTVNSTITVTPTSASVSTDTAQVFLGVVTGGVGPFTYQWFNLTSGTPVAMLSTVYPLCSTSISCSITPVSSGTYTYDLAVKDQNSVPANEVSTSPIITLTASTSGGGSTGGGGGSTGGGGGSGSGNSGGSGKPIITLNTVSGVAQFDTFNVSVGLGQTFNVTENYITPTSAGVTVDGQSYNLTPGVPVGIGSNATATAYMELTNITYVPIQHTVTITFYSVLKPVTGAPPANTTTTIVAATTTVASGTSTPTTTILQTTPSTGVFAQIDAFFSSVWQSILKAFGK